MLIFTPNQHIRFMYHVGYGVVEEQHVIFRTLDFGSARDREKPQWFLTGFCVKKQVMRSFALLKMEVIDE